MVEWLSRPLKELTTKIGSGATPRGGKSVYTDEGVAFIRSQNVYDNQFSGADIARISPEAARALDGVAVEANDVLVNITGESVARTCSMDEGFLPARVSQHVSIVRADQHVLDPAFLRYTLLAPPVKSRMNLLSQAGATRRALTKGHLEELMVPVPPLGEQRRIAGVLGAFDDLIETNLRTVTSLEALGDTLLRVGSSGGKTKRLDEACDVIESGKRPRGGVKGIMSGVPSLGAEFINGLTLFPFEKTKFVPSEFADGMRRGVIEDMDVLVYKDGGKPGEFFPDVSAVGRGYPFDRMVINEHVFRVRAQEEIGQGYLYFWLHSHEMMQAMKEIGSRTAAIPGMNASNFGALPFRSLSPGLEGLYVRFDTLLEGSLELLAEARDVARRRDELLPLLMSGKVRVSEVEESLP